MAKRLFENIFTKTVMVSVEGPDGWIRAICYVDDGANVSLIQLKLANAAALLVTVKLCSISRQSAKSTLRN